MSKTPEELAEDYSNSQNCLDDQTSRRHAFLAGYQAAAPQWISVKERLPELNEHNYSDDVIMFGKRGIEVTHIEKTKRIVRWKGLQEVVETNNGSSIDQYTHWMPLPEPPKDAKE